MLDYSIERSPLRNFNLSYKFSYNNLDIYEKGDKRFNTTYTHHLAEFAYSDMNWLSFKVKAGLRYEYFNYNSFLYTGSDELYTVKPEGFLVISHRHISKHWTGGISQIGEFLWRRTIHSIRTTL